MAFLRDVEYDDFTGITKRWYLDGDRIVCHKTFEEDDFIDKVRESYVDESFINNNKVMHKMATLPVIVVEKIMKEHGLNLMGELTPSEQRKLHRIIETEYPWCKTHSRKLWRPV